MSRERVPDDSRLDRAEVRGAADGLRAVLATLDEPGSDLTASAATRHRIEGAATALDVVLGETGSDDPGASANDRL